MARFSYHAVNAEGNPVAGQIDAPDESQALRALQDGGLQAIKLTRCSTTASKPVGLGESEATELLAQLAQTTMTSGALVDGLQAASLEATNRRVASALRVLAAEIDRGKELPAALAEAATRMPVHVRGLVAAASRTGRLGPALDDLVEHHRGLRANFWSIWGSLLYPLVVLSLALVVLSLFLIWIVPVFGEMFQQFDLKLPASTQLLLQGSLAFRWLIIGPAKFLLAATLLACFVLAWLAATGRGGAWLQRFVAALPILGPLWTWSGAASFMHLLALLLDYEIPLPDALRLTADGMKHMELRRVGGWLADRVRGGESLAALIEASGCIPGSAVPVLRWGEQSGVMAEAARTVADMFADRVRTRTSWLRSISPPMIYVFVVFSLGLAIVSLFAPLVALIQGLT